LKALSKETDIDFTFTNKYEENGSTLLKSLGIKSSDEVNCPITSCTLQIVSKTKQIDDLKIGDS